MARSPFGEGGPFPFVWRATSPAASSRLPVRGAQNSEAWRPGRRSSREWCARRLVVGKDGHHPCYAVSPAPNSATATTCAATGRARGSATAAGGCSTSCRGGSSTRSSATGTYVPLLPSGRGGHGLCGTKRTARRHSQPTGGRTALALEDLLMRGSPYRCRRCGDHFSDEMLGYTDAASGERFCHGCVCPCCHQPYGRDDGPCDAMHRCDQCASAEEWRRLQHG